jgi:thiosulfate dehydrogenase (quinone) large subunit
LTRPGFAGSRAEGQGTLAPALLPIRLFFGATFLYAGLDKLLDPTFFDGSSGTSIQAQLEAFARGSPLSGLILASLPAAVPIGLAIAVAEIGIGIGTLSGLAYRLAAAGGAALSLLFFLTASWTTRPYYFGPDLPYLAGWVTLALAGHHDVLVPRQLRASRRARDAEPAASPERRAILQAGALAALAALVASFSLPLRALGITTGARGGAVAGGAGAGAGRGSGDASGSPPATRGPSPEASGVPATLPPGGLAIGTTAAVTRSGSLAFTVPFQAPPPFPAGDPGVIVALPDGSFVAYDAICTHAGCTVEWDAADGVLLCPCHGAAFDAAHDGEVLQGPTRQPLQKLPLVIDPATGTILLSG